MATTKVNRILTIAGKSFRQAYNVDSNTSLIRDQVIGPAKAGTLTTRSSNTHGIVTLESGHGFVLADKMDMYFPDGTRRQMDVGTVTVNVVPISGGAGDNLPTVSESISAMEPVATEMRFDGDDCEMIALTAKKRAIAVLTGDDNVEDTALVMDVANQAQSWDSGSGQTNPIVGDTITKAHLSHEDTTATVTVSIAVAYD